MAINRGNYIVLHDAWDPAYTWAYCAPTYGRRRALVLKVAVRGDGSCALSVNLPRCRTHAATAHVQRIRIRRARPRAIYSHFPVAAVPDAATWASSHGTSSFPWASCLLPPRREDTPAAPDAVADAAHQPRLLGRAVATGAASAAGASAAAAPRARARTP